MGRPAIKNAVRTPSGQISRAKDAYEKAVSPAEWSRLRDDYRAKARNNVLLGSELGRLLFHEHITSTEFEAGRRYAETVRKCLRTIGLRCMEPGDATRGSGRAFPVPGCAEWLEMTEDGQRASNALAAIEAVLTLPQRKAVEQVCVRSLVADDYAQLVELRHGLRALHVHFAKTKRR